MSSVAVPKPPPNEELPPLADLQATRVQIEKELQLLTGSLSQLKDAQQRFGQSVACLDALKSSKKGQETLLPLTTSVYVKGNLKIVDKVVIDIGTGYYVEKDLASAEDYYKRRVKYVQEQVDKLQAAISEKKQMSALLVQAMQQKMAAGGGDAE